MNTTGRTRKIVAGLALAGVLGLSAVGVASAVDGASPSTADQTTSSTSPHTDAETQDSGTGTATHGQTGKAVPASLNDLEGQAEDVIDMVAANEWATIRQDLADMQTNWTSYQPIAKADGVPATIRTAMATALTELDKAVAAQDAAATAQAANDFSAGTVEAMSMYDVGHPVQIGRLDVIGRQIAIDAQAGDFTGASNQIEAAQTQLDQVSTSLTDHGGKDVLTQAQATLKQLRTYVTEQNADAAKTQANVFLEIVDRMEQLYA